MAEIPSKRQEAVFLPTLVCLARPLLLREFFVVAKQYSGSKYWLFLLLITICANSYADESIKQYFKSDDSALYENDDITSSNRNGQNPIVTINRFDISRLKDLPEYGIVSSDLENIIRKDQKTNNSRYTIDRLELLAETLSMHYKKQGLILAKVFFPPQNVKNRSLYLDIVLGQIETVNTQRNDYYSSERLTRPFKDILDKPAYVPTLESTLIELNKYPGIAFDTHFREGSTLGTTQIDIRVKDEQLSDFSFNFDNYGSEYTGSMRAMLRGSFYNLADQADQFDVNVPSND